jgi:hypothetical protein
MGHVGHKVVADLLSACDFGAVIGQQENVFLSEHRCPDLHDDGALPERAPRQLELLFQDHAVPADISRHVQQLPVHHGVAPHQAVRIGGRTCADHAVDGVHHHKSLADDGEHFSGARGQRRLVEFDVDNLPLLLADPEGEHTEDAERQAEQAGDNTDEHWIHGSSLCFRNARKAVPGPERGGFS